MEYIIETENLVKQYGTTILISSHVLNEIEQIADMIGVMHEGRLIEEVNCMELHKRTPRYIEFHVYDTAAAVKLLETHFQVTDYLIHGNAVQMNDCTHSCGEINKIFVENGLLVNKVNLCEENLENYFSDLIGGAGIG